MRPSTCLVIDGERCFLPRPARLAEVGMFAYIFWQRSQKKTSPLSATEMAFTKGNLAARTC
jgi:hypothetical protein